MLMRVSVGIHGNNLDKAIEVNNRFKGHHILSLSVSTSSTCTCTCTCTVHVHACTCTCMCMYCTCMYMYCLFKLSINKNYHPLEELAIHYNIVYLTTSTATCTSTLLHVHTLYIISISFCLDL